LIDAIDEQVQRQASRKQQTGKYRCGYGRPGMTRQNVQILARSLLRIADFPAKWPV
jgi:hypothetical protein